MTSVPSLQTLRETLGLEPNQTCGYVRNSYTSPIGLAAGSLNPPFEAERPVGSALYFLVTPDAPVRLHRIQNDQLYHYYLGDPLELILLRPDHAVERVIIGPDIVQGQHLQFPIPGGTFHTARLLGDGDWFLGGSTEWPGVIPADVEIGDPETLAAAYPDAAETIHAIAAIACAINREPSA
jgi:predicted cupin superfamily sugar epimerase